MGTNEGYQTVLAELLAREARAERSTMGKKIW